MKFDRNVEYIILILFVSFIRTIFEKSLMNNIATRSHISLAAALVDKVP